MAERKFSMSVANLLEHADVISIHLAEDIKLFNAFDPMAFDTKLPSIIEQKATEAFIKGDDTINKVQLSTKTQELQSEIENCRAYLNDLEYWVKKGFIDNPAIQKQFGIGRITALFRRQAVLIQFMENLPETIKNHEDELKKVGTPKELLCKATTISKAIRQANKEQEQQKGNRTIDTEARVILLNDLYDVLKMVDDASVSVFKEQPVKRNLYKIPRQKGNSNEILDTSSTEVV